MVPDKELSKDRKALLLLIAGGALTAGGYLTYVWWSKRRASASKKPQVEVKKTVTDHNVTRTEPSTEKVEMRAAPVVKERIDVSSFTSAAVTDLSTSSTFEKVSTSASPEPDSFVQLSMSSFGSSEVPASPSAVRAARERQQEDENSIEVLSESSSSFIAISSASSSMAAQPPQNVEAVMEVKNDIVHVEKSSPEDGSGDRSLSADILGAGDAGNGTLAQDSAGHDPEEEESELTGERQQDDDDDDDDDEDEEADDDDEVAEAEGDDGDETIEYNPPSSFASTQDAPEE